MTVHVKITVDSAGAEAALQQLAQRAANLRPVYAAIGEYLKTETQKRMAAETAPDGSRWAPLKASTLAGKAASLDKPSMKILRASGALADTIRWQVTQDGVLVGSDRMYARIHQFGGKTSPHEIKPKTKQALAWPGGGPVAKVNHPGSLIPARPFLGVSASDRTEVQEILSDYLTGRL